MYIYILLSHSVLSNSWSSHFAKKFPDAIKTKKFSHSSNKECEQCIFYSKEYELLQFLYSSHVRSTHSIKYCNFVYVREFLELNSKLRAHNCEQSSESSKSEYPLHDRRKHESSSN